MSEEDKKESSVCENFEPQAWRKTVCKNCFQSPDVHAARSIENGGTETSGDIKGKPGSIIAVDKKTAASSLKNKYEQLEKDKYKPKETSSHTLPRTKKAGGLTLITGQYDQLDREAGKMDSPTKHIPPPTPPKPSRKDGSMSAKFGSMENVSAEIDISDNKLGMKFKFGSMENISHGSDQKKETVLSPIAQKPKFGGSVENISTHEKDGRLDMLSKLDSFQNEVKVGKTSKAGQTVVHKQKDGHVDIITLPSKSTDSKPNQSSSLNLKASPVKVNEKLDSKSKFEKPELKTTNDKETISSKIELKPKFGLKSTNDADKQNEPKGAKDLLTNKLKSTKVNENDKPKTDEPRKLGFNLKDQLKSKKTEENTSKSSDLRVGLKKPELKSSSDKEESKPLSFKDRLGKPSDKQKTDEPKKLSINLKDQLKSPSVEKDPLSKLKDKLKSPETDTKQAPSWKDRLKSSSDADKTSDIQSKISKPETKTEPETKSKATSKIGSQVEIEKVKSSISSDKKPITEKVEVTKNEKNIAESESSNKLNVVSKFTNKNDSKSDNKKSDNENKFSSSLTRTKDKETENKISLDTKFGVKGPSAEKTKSDDGGKTLNKELSNDLKSKPSKFSKDEETKPKTIDLRNNLKKQNDAPSGDKDLPKLDTKKKFELPSLKSSKTQPLNDQSKDTKEKEDSNQAKSSSKIGNKFEPKFKLNKTNEPKPSAVEEAGFTPRDGFHSPVSVSKLTETMSKVVDRLAKIGPWAMRKYQLSANYSAKKLPIFRKYAMVELVPPTPSEVVQAVGQAKALLQKGVGGIKDLTVFQALLGVLVCWEPLMWFFAGEVIGRRGLRGYKIEGTLFLKFVPVYTHSMNVGLDIWDLKTEPVE